MSDKPKLLLHICCAPDEVYVIHSMKDEFKLHCFFCNPNISPESEYQKRLDEARMVAEKYGVPFSADKYNPESWDKRVKEPFGDTPEKGERCNHCFDMRLERTAKFCKEELGWNSFSSVLSMSPQKKIEMIDRAGFEAAEKYGVTFEPYNFKKKNGYLESKKLSDKYNLYRQDYCGCSLSKAEREDQKKEKNSLQ
jgi:predicted adenine nucleotide alpha hydrolase (AANH) superfamily ATPase